MIYILKTKTDQVPTVLLDNCIDVRYLGANQFGDHYHEINSRMATHRIVAVCKTHPYVIDYAFDYDFKVRGFRDFKLIYQEIHRTALV